MPSFPPIRYAKGRVEPANLDHLRQLSQAQHGARLRALRVITPPANWDSRNQNWIGAIKDQAQCGSCWDFSGTGVVEVACNVAGVGGGPVNMILSEQYTLDCAQNGGCNGDDNTTVLTWAQATGLPLSEAYGPYTSGSGNSGRCKWLSSETLYKIASWGFADANGGQGVTPVSDIKLAILTYGCVGAAIAANDAFMNNPPGTVFQGGGGGQNQIDHDIILVGWDDTKGSSGAWILRNSWGPTWCDSGYCFTGDTKIPLLNGRERSLKELADGVEGDVFWVYSCDDNGLIVPGRAHSPRLTHRNAPLLEVTLDNGESIRCTPNHQFMLRDGSYREAKELVAGDSLMPLYRKTGNTMASMPGYEKLYIPGIRRWRYTHREVAGFAAGGRYFGMVHHADFDKRNNAPDNLEIMSWGDHSRLHAEFAQVMSEYNRSEKGRKTSRENMEKIWDDPTRREQLIRIMTECNRKNGLKRQGKPNSKEHIAAVGAALRELYQRDESARIRARQRAVHANKASVEKVRRFGITEAQLAARQENIKKAAAVANKKCVNHKVVSVLRSGFEDVYDLSVDDFHNFALSAGVFVHNCWIAYGANLVGTESVFAFIAPAPGPPAPPLPPAPPVPPAPPAPPGPNDNPFPTQGILTFDFGTRLWSQSGFALKGQKPEQAPSVRLGDYP